MLKITKAILFITIFWSTASYAEVAAPLGIEPGKSTLKDVEAKYKIISTNCEKKVKANCLYTINPKKLLLTNFIEVSFVCNSQGIVRAVFMKATKNSFEELFESLSKKYKLEGKSIPFVGDKGAVFQADNNVVVTLNAPHMSFEVTLMYIIQEDFNRTTEERNKEKQNKKQTLDDAL